MKTKKQKTIEAIDIIIHRIEKHGIVQFSIPKCPLCDIHMEQKATNCINIEFDCRGCPLNMENKYLPLPGCVQMLDVVREFGGHAMSPWQENRKPYFVLEGLKELKRKIENTNPIHFTKSKQSSPLYTPAILKELRGMVEDDYKQNSL